MTPDHHQPNRREAPRTARHVMLANIIDPDAFADPYDEYLDRRREMALAKADAIIALEATPDPASSVAMREATREAAWEAWSSKFVFFGRGAKGDARAGFDAGWGAATRSADPVQPEPAKGPQALLDAVREFGPNGEIVPVRAHPDGGWDAYDPKGPNCALILAELNAAVQPEPVEPKVSTNDFSMRKAANGVSNVLPEPVGDEVERAKAIWDATPHADTCELRLDLGPRTYSCSCDHHERAIIAALSRATPSVAGMGEVPDGSPTKADKEWARRTYFALSNIHTRVNCQWEHEQYLSKQVAMYRRALFLTATPPAQHPVKHEGVDPVLPRLTERMIRAACKAHYSESNIDGVDLTSHGVNWSFRRGFQRMWAGIRAELKKGTSGADDEGVER